MRSLGNKAEKLLDQRWVLVLLFACGMLATTYFFGWVSSFPNSFEADRLFHLSALREAQLQGTWVLRHWDQFPLLGWKDFFADKEFLFHFLLRVPYSAFGDEGAIYGCLFFSALLVWLPFLFFRGNRIFALAVSIAVLPAHQYLLYRFTLIRPHDLAALLFSLLVMHSFLGRFRLAALTALVFNLAYHAFYLPLLAAALALVCSLFFPSKELPENHGPKWRRGSAWLLLGSIAGLVLNPYFPANIVQAIQHLALGLRVQELQRNLQLQFGGELQPRQPLEFLIAWWGAIVALIAGAYFAIRQTITREKLFLVLLSLVFFLGCFVTPRMLEFGAPVWILFLVAVFGSSHSRAKLAVIIIIAGSQALPLTEFFRNAQISTGEESPAVAGIALLLKAIPSSTTTPRIFHDNWALGPYIAYANPNAEAIDLLDPSFLLFANPKLTALRAELIQGNVGDPVRAIREAFGAEYALCEPSALQAQLLATPGVKVIAATVDKRFILFRLPLP